MTGNLSVKEWPINWKFKPNKIQSNGDLTWTLLRTVAISSKRSNFKSNSSFPTSRSVLEKMNEELSKTLERITRSEGQINSSMSSIG